MVFVTNIAKSLARSMEVDLKNMHRRHLWCTFLNRQNYVCPGPQLAVVPFLCWKYHRGRLPAEWCIWCSLSSSPSYFLPKLGIFFKQFVWMSSNKLLMFPWELLLALVLAMLLLLLWSKWLALSYPLDIVFGVIWKKLSFLIILPLLSHSSR